MTEKNRNPVRNLNIRTTWTSDSSVILGLRKSEEVLDVR